MAKKRSKKNNSSKKISTQSNAFQNLEKDVNKYATLIKKIGIRG